MTLELTLLALAAFAAGLVDAVAGGGGLLQLPALFAVYPEAHAATLFGTNKGASVWGTAAAVSQLPAAWLRPGVLVTLVLVAVYTLRRRELGLHHAPRLAGGREALAGAALGAGIGFYDGIFGPGTGSFLVFALVRGFGYDFLHASATAKLINVATNVAALTLFAGTGHVWWQTAGVMAVCNVAGSLVGSHAALRGGAVFVRRLFLLVTSALILKMGVDLLRLAG